MRSRDRRRLLHFIEYARGGGIVVQQILRRRELLLMRLVTHRATLKISAIRKVRAITPAANPE